MLKTKLQRRFGIGGGASDTSIKEIPPSPEIPREQVALPALPVLPGSEGPKPVSLPVPPPAPIVSQPQLHPNISSVNQVVIDMRWVDSHLADPRADVQWSNDYEWSFNGCYDMSVTACSAQSDTQGFHTFCELLITQLLAPD